MCGKLCFWLDALFVDERDFWRVFAIQDCCFMSHERVAGLYVTTLGNTIHHHSHATMATTHALYTGHKPRCMPRPCLCTAYFNKIRYITENLSAFTQATKATAHVAFARHVLRCVPSSMPMHNRL